MYWTNFWISMHRRFGKFLWKSTIEAGSNYLPKQKPRRFTDFRGCFLRPKMSETIKVACIGAGYVGGSTMAMMAWKCPNIIVTCLDLNEVPPSNCPRPTLSAAPCTAAHPQSTAIQPCAPSKNSFQPYCISSRERKSSASSPYHSFN